MTIFWITGQQSHWTRMDLHNVASVYIYVQYITHAFDMIVCIRMVYTFSENVTAPVVWSTSAMCPSLVPANNRDIPSRCSVSGSLVNCASRESFRASNTTPNHLSPHNISSILSYMYIHVYIHDNNNYVYSTVYQNSSSCS